MYGLCREPVFSATGYGGVVTHLMAPDGARYSVADVRPGGLARARGAGSASVALGGATLDHAGLARGGLRIVGATVSPEGRLGAGRGVRATPLPGTPWTEQPAAPLFARPAAEAVAELSADPEAAESALLGCDVTVVGAAGEHLLVREARPDGPLLRLLPAHPHPELPHTENLRRIASYPGLLIRVLGRPDLDRAATLRPVAVGPVPGAPYTLRLPDEWLGRADLGYDRLQGMHFPRATRPPNRSRQPTAPTRSPTPRCGGCAASWRPGSRAAAAPSPRRPAVRSRRPRPPTARCAGPGSPRRRTWPQPSPPRPTAAPATPSAASRTPRPTATPGPGWPRPPTSRRRNAPWSPHPGPRPRAEPRPQHAEADVTQPAPRTDTVHQRPARAGRTGMPASLRPGRSPSTTRGPRRAVSGPATTARCVPTGHQSTTTSTNDPMT
ncbi:hypothetical protein WKI68_01345 [Streptomyces sp. MS1.HAVA.3]|uniref:Uncharacterized protein n=1 Tax=Streptomyces caledonius TaxID=3134107 RepID=A0ABU8TXU8_9ACTN